MHTITINIKDDNVANKVIWFLRHLKDDGVEIVDNKANELDKLYLDFLEDKQNNRLFSTNSSDLINRIENELQVGL